MASPTTADSVSTTQPQHPEPVSPSPFPAPADSSQLLTTSPPPFTHLPASAVHRLLPLPALLRHLHSSLASVSPSVISPPRHHHRLTPTSLLLLMPAWSHHPTLPFIGVKLLTSSPALHGTYLLLSSISHIPLLSLDALPLTLLRTAAVSALASSYLSRKHPLTLLMLGAGALSPYLIAAHIHTRPTITSVLIYNRTKLKADLLAETLKLSYPDINFTSADDLVDAIPLADIVSCATASETPLVYGRLLKEGAHLDLVGSFRKGMRECDDEAIRRGRVFVDDEMAVEEAGELVGAIERGVMRREDVAGTLAELVGGRKVGRRGEEEVTVFKSVGTARVDLIAAQLVYENYVKEQTTGR